MKYLIISVLALTLTACGSIAPNAVATTVAVDKDQRVDNNTDISRPNPPSTPSTPTADAPKPAKTGCNGSRCGAGSGRGSSEGREHSRNDND